VVSTKDYEKVEWLVKEFLRVIGEDPEREGLRETPRRVSRMLLDELLIGYRYDPKEFLKLFEHEEEDYYEAYGDLVIVKDVAVRSLCEHHLLPFFGYAHIAYIPTKYILGLSKFSRIVNIFSRKLQVQERLTNQIADFIMEYVKAKGCLVVIEAIHTCALLRGVKENLKLITLSTRGVFSKDQRLRSEALSLMGIGKDLIRE